MSPFIRPGRALVGDDEEDPLAPVARELRERAGIDGDRGVLAVDADAWRSSRDPAAMLTLLSFTRLPRATRRALLERIAYAPSLGSLLATWRRVEGEDGGAPRAYDGQAYDLVWTMTGRLTAQLRAMPAELRRPLCVRLADDIRALFPEPPELQPRLVGPRG